MIEAVRHLGDRWKTQKARWGLSAVLLSALATGSMLAKPPGEVAPAHSQDLSERRVRPPLSVDTLEDSESENGSLIDPCPYGRLYDFPTNDGLVGFIRDLPEDDCLQLQMFETRVVADIEALKSEGAILITHAVLRYDEPPTMRRSPWAANDTCVGSVTGLVSVDIVEKALVLRTNGWEAERDGPEAWDVTTQVRRWFTGADENRGFLLRPQVLPGGHSRDTATCLSALTDVRLDVVIQVPPPVLHEQPLPLSIIVAREPTPPPPTSTPIVAQQRVRTNDIVAPTSTPTHLPVVPNTPVPPFVQKPLGGNVIIAATATPTSTPGAFQTKPRSGVTQ